MKIAFCINDNYYDKVAVVITSILENNTDNNIEFYIFNSDLSKQNFEKLDSLKFKYKNFTIKEIKINPNIFSKFNISIEHTSIETYFRYLIADLLPNTDKILYLDADLIVNDSISDFYNIDLNDYYIAGVEDLYINNIKYKKEINLSTNDLYINAGVLLMNLSKMREDNLAEKFIELNILLQEKIKYQDQDIINIVCKDKIKQVDSIYNFTQANVTYEIDKRKKAVIIHYTGKNKPWCKQKIRISRIFKFWNRKKYDRMFSLWKKYSNICNKNMKIITKNQFENPVERLC